jgi:hypothetical protein
MSSKKERVGDVWCEMLGRWRKKKKKKKKRRGERRRINRRRKMEGRLMEEKVEGKNW